MTEIDPRFQRNHGVISAEVMQKLANTHILVAGVGGAGGQCAMDLARLGFGYLTLADPDTYELHNCNRQAGCFESTLGKNKVDIIERMTQDVNPKIQIRKIIAGVTRDNVESLFTHTGWPDVSFVVEAIDGVAPDAKRAVHDVARKRGVVAMTGLMLGFGAALHVFQPDAPSYDKLFFGADGKINFPSVVPRTGSYMSREVLDRHFAGQGYAPTCTIGATTASALMVSEIMRGILNGPRAMTSWPECIYVDHHDHVYFRGRPADLPGS